jgi:hypothetical protein
MKFLPSILVLSFAIILLTAQVSFGAQAADECLARPGASGPKGTHWYYRVNREDGRHCWYLSSQAAQTNSRPRLMMRESSSPSPQPATDASVQQAEQIPTQQTVAVESTPEVTAADFAKRWPAAPMPADLVTSDEPRAVEDAKDTKEQTSATPPIVESKPAEVLPDSDKANMGPITFVGAVAMLSLLLVGGILKFAGYLENRLFLANVRFGSHIFSGLVEAADPEPAARMPDDRFDRQAATPTDPAQDLKRSLRELMQDLRRASAAADARVSFDLTPRPKTRPLSAVRPLLVS